MTAHSELVARLEGASEGSRELDRDLVVMLRPFRDIDEYRAGVQAEPEMSWWVTGDTRCSTSLDAALALASRVLPGWCWEVRTDADGAGVQGAPAWWNEGLASIDIGGVAVESPTPALALCLAILKATATQPSDDGEKR